jgi:hypothetical protein
MAWLRLDEHIPENKKVQLIPAELFRFWINALCVSKKTDGKLPDLEAAAFRLRMPKVRLVMNLERLRSKGLVDFVDDVYCLHDWEDWQYKDAGTASRVRRFRDKHKPVTETDCNGVTVTPSVTVPVTDVKRPASVYSVSVNSEQEGPLVNFDLLTYRERLCKKWGKQSNRRLCYALIERVLASGIEPIELELAVDKWAKYWKGRWVYCHMTLQSWLEAEGWRDEPEELVEASQKDGAWDNIS